MERKINELEGETNGACCDSFTEQVSEMFNNFFKTVKEEIKNENKEFNLALIEFIKNLNHSVKTRNFLHFKVLVPYFLAKKYKDQSTAYRGFKKKIYNW